MHCLNKVIYNFLYIDTKYIGKVYYIEKERYNIVNGLFQNHAVGYTQNMSLFKYVSKQFYVFIIYIFPSEEKLKTMTCEHNSLSKNTLQTEFLYVI